MSYNKCVLIGRLVRDPELKTTPNGVSVCTFALAVDRRFTAKGAEKQTDFINIVAWRQTADFVSRYFSKGSAMGVEGSIQTRSYEDKTGAKRTAVEVVAEKVFFVEGKKDKDDAPKRSEGEFGAIAEEPPKSGAYKQDFEQVDDTEDLPF